eukprot:6493644-Karenia_brevis.AAC.1
MYRSCHASLDQYHEDEAPNTRERPWTLSRKFASAEVPLITQLGLSSDESSSTVRMGWKEYLTQACPHSFHTIGNFVGCCMAEGSSDKDNDEDEHAPRRDIKFTWDMDT